MAGFSVAGVDRLVFSRLKPTYVLLVSERVCVPLLRRVLSGWLWPRRDAALAVNLYAYRYRKLVVVHFVYSIPYGLSTGSRGRGQGLQCSQGSVRVEGDFMYTPHTALEISR